MDSDSKILGKYRIIREESATLKVACYNERLYRIEIVPKTPQSGKYSDIAKTINSVSHKNISNLKIEEDDNNFYFIDRVFGDEYSELQADCFGQNHVSLIKCYLQIIEAVEYIHQNGFYHGNINPKNILIERGEDNAYLLDFGRCYIYAILKDTPDKIFCAPEQIERNECCKESDIYSLGLCMLNLLLESQLNSSLFAEEYHDFNSLEKIYELVTEKESWLTGPNPELFLIIKKMLKEIPEERAELSDVHKELSALLDKILPHKTFAIKISDRVLNKWAEDHGCDICDVTKNIYDKMGDRYACLEFEKDREGRDEIRINIGDVIFYCSADKITERHDFFCFIIREDPFAIENLQKYGLRTEDTFKILMSNRDSSGCDHAGRIIWDLKKRYEQKQLEDRRYETDKTSIVTEEELLKAEKATIDEKKNTRKVVLRKIDNGKNTLKFEYAVEKDKEDEDGATKDETAETQSKRPDKKEFKPNQDVILQKKEDDDDDVLKGSVIKPEQGYPLTIQLEKKYDVEKSQDPKSGTLQLKEGREYFLCYDYQVEEIIWKKKKLALEQLQNRNTYIPNFIRKINRPEEFIKNDLVDVPKFYNDQLDVNQQLAVQKSYSLDNGCEVMILQGPPGTGKTVTITEIATQILKTRPHERILVASQSNQAVDNVLEKICGIEDKILRIGNDKNKISTIAQNYLPDEVLNKIIKENIERIDQNPVSHPNEGIQEKMLDLQKNFRKDLQYITSRLADKKGEKNNKEAELAALFTRSIRLIFGTLIGISSWSSFREIVFDTVIVDEAGRAALSEILVPCIKAKKLILVGDHKQLAPVIYDDVMEKIDDKKEAKTSFFQRLFERIEKTDRENLLHTLTYNYRAERRICNLYSNTFYEGKLITTDAVNEKKQHQLSFCSSVVWYDTGKLENREDEQEGTGKINRCNAECIKRILNQIKAEMKERQLSYNIGIITPYKAQEKLLGDKLAVKKNFPDCMIDIGTVDSFQGSDRDIIIYDCVRSAKLKDKANIGFIAEEKRLNVSLSRAKLLLIIVGDKDFLYRAQVKEGDNPFGKIIEYIHQNKDQYVIKGAVQ